MFKIIDLIVEGIAKAIRKDFSSDDFKVYTEFIEQGINESFFIKCKERTEKPFIKGRYRLDADFDIQFITSEKNKNDICQNVANLLYSSLEFISFDDGLIRGNKMKHEITEGILHFYVTYTTFFYRFEKQNVDFMETLSVKEKTI